MVMAVDNPDNCTRKAVPIKKCLIRLACSYKHSTNNVIERLNRENCCCTRMVGSYALMLLFDGWYLVGQ